MPGRGGSKLVLKMTIDTKDGKKEVTQVKDVVNELGKVVGSTEKAFTKFNNTIKTQSKLTNNTIADLIRVVSGLENKIKTLDRTTAAVSRSMNNNFQNNIKFMENYSNRQSQFFLKMENRVSGLEGKTKSLNKTNKEAVPVVNSFEEAIKKLEGSSKGTFSQFEKGVIFLNQFLELMRKGKMLIEIMAKPVVVAGQFEQYQMALKNMIGSTEEAKRRLADLVNFAKVTPFTIPQVIQAGNQLQAL
ncbi:MAG: hypothetical protein WC389_16285, partial [Lutibacter sp.]